MAVESGLLFVMLSVTFIISQHASWQRNGLIFWYLPATSKLPQHTTGVPIRSE